MDSMFISGSPTQLSHGMMEHVFRKSKEKVLNPDENLSNAERKKDAEKHESYSTISSAMLTVATFASGITFNIILKPSGDSPALALVYLSYANSLFCGAIMGCVLIKVSIELCKSSVDYVLEWKQKVKDVKYHDLDWVRDIQSRIAKRKEWKSGKRRWKRLLVKEFRLTYEGGPRDMLLEWLYTEECAARMMHEIGHWILGIETVIVAAILFVALYFLLLACKYFVNIEGPFIAGTIIYCGFCCATAFMVCVLSFFGNWMRWKENTMGKEDTIERESFWIFRHVVYGLCLFVAVCIVDAAIFWKMKGIEDTSNSTTSKQEEGPRKEEV